MTKKTIIPDIDLNEYDYPLPQERIADFPLEDRSNSKLLYVNKSNKISHHVFREIPELLPIDSMLVFNNTKVIAARLLMHKETGGSAELLCVEPAGKNRDPQMAMLDRNISKWLCIVGGKRINEGKVLFSKDNKLRADILERFENKAIVKFCWDDDCSFAEIIDSLGNVPLPPYIKRAPVESDKDRYQTVYANYDGSVAAPTAGLHFTSEVLEQVEDKNIKMANVTLHVGPGTFKPIDSGNINEHDMHREMISIYRSELEKIVDYQNQDNPKLICVGTTSVRTIETLYWIGAKLLHGIDINIDKNEISLDQWDSYKIISEYGMSDANEAFNELLKFMNKESLEVLIARTKLFIVPGYKFGAVKGMITNYHIPKSTLILLVAAFLGKDLWEKVYTEALKNNYRFLSYGDSSFLDVRA